MPNFSFKNSNSVFGLDIGYETLKLAQIKQEKGGYSLVGATEIPLSEKILDRDKFRNKADTANLIRTAMKNAKPNPITAKAIVSALPETFVFSKTVKMPKMTREEYLSAIPNEISDFLPIPITDIYFDFQILVSHPDEPLNDILVVATPKRLVDDYVEMAELADLELVALETKPLAVGRAIIGDEDKSGSLIIHLGKEYSRIAIWDDGNLKLTTTVNIGQNQLLESLGYVGKVDKKEIKLTTANEKDISIPLNTIIDEVINAIKYHLNRSYKPKPISHIMLCGSGISINGLDLLIEKEVKIKTTIKKIKLKNKESLPPQYIVAFGLAQRKEEE